MKQIPENTFISIVNKLKKSDDFEEFVERVQKRVDNFLKKPKFSYSEGIGRKKKTIKYEIGKKSDSRSKKYKKILDSISDVERIMFMSSSMLKKETVALQGFQLDVGNDIDKGFSQTLQSILRYSELRSGDKKLLYSFYKELGIKSCIYCNSQHTILLKDTEKTMRLQADHYIAKSKYPTFSITLANLFPTCNNCNHLKSDKEISYSLYYDDTKLKHHDLGFKVTPESLNNYYLNRNKNNAENYLEVEFTDYYNGDLKNSSKLNEILKIDKIYENHKDIIADLISKKIVYKDSYLETLGEEFGGLFKRKDGTINKHLFNQMIYGHSLDENDVNKRVFSKLTIDVKKQLDSYDFTTAKKSEID